MINQAFYRLGRYRITDYGGGQLLWERHVALGEQQSGRCFVCGDVLIIGHCSHQESGYLIGEFLEHLEKLQAWNKTRYYCSASSLFDVNSQGRPSNGVLEERLSLLNLHGPHLTSGISLQMGTFRLGRYKLTVAEGDIVSWQTYESPDKIIGGRCILESNLLLICPQDFSTEGQSKKGFLNVLEQLPKWDKTIAWSQSEVLLPCRQGLEIGHTRLATDPQRMKRDPVDSKPAITGQCRFKEAAAKLASSSFAWLRADVRPPKKRRDPGAHVKPVIAGKYRFKEAAAKLASSCFAWLIALRQRLAAGKVWLKFLIPLVVVGLLFGLAAAYHSAKERFPWGHWFKEHHHKRDDHDRR